MPRSRETGVQTLPCLFLLLTNMNVHKKYFIFHAGPEGDWRIIFLSTVALALILTLVNLSFFFLVKDEDRGDADVLSQSRTLNLDVIRRTTSYYQGKKAVLEQVLSGTTTPADPSL